MSQFGAGYGTAGRNISRGVPDVAPTQQLTVAPGTSQIRTPISTASPANQLAELVTAMRDAAVATGRTVGQAVSSKNKADDAAAKGAAETAGDTYGQVVGESYDNDDIEQYDDEGNAVSNNADQLVAQLHAAHGEGGNALLAQSIDAHANQIAMDSVPDGYPENLIPLYVTKAKAKLIPSITNWYGRRTKERRMINASMLTQHLANGTAADLRTLGIRPGRDSKAFARDLRQNPNFAGLNQDDLYASQLAAAQIALTDNNFKRSKLLLDTLPDGILAEDQAKLRSQLVSAEREYYLNEGRSTIYSLTSDVISYAHSQSRGQEIGFMGRAMGTERLASMRALVDRAENDTITNTRFKESVLAWNADQSRGGGNALSYGERVKVLTELLDTRIVQGDQLVRAIPPNSAIGTTLSQLIVELPGHEAAFDSRLKPARDQQILDAENQSILLVTTGEVKIGDLTMTTRQELENYYGQNFPDIAGHVTKTIQQTLDLDVFQEDQHNVSGRRRSRELMVSLEDEIRYGSFDVDSGQLHQSKHQRVQVGHRINEAYTNGKISLEDRNRLLNLSSQTDKIEGELGARDFREAQEHVMTSYWQAAGAELAVRGDVLTASNWALPMEANRKAYIAAPDISRGVLLAWESWVRENESLRSHDQSAYDRKRAAFLSQLSSAYAEIAMERGYQYSPQAESEYRKWYKDLRTKKPGLPQDSESPNAGYDYRALYESDWEPEEGKPIQLPPAYQIKKNPANPVIDGIDIVTGTAVGLPIQTQSKDTP